MNVISYFENEHVQVRPLRVGSSIVSLTCDEFVFILGNVILSLKARGSS